MIDSCPFILDEKPYHPDSSLEWWYVHGAFCGDNISRKSFMVTIFRQQIDSHHRTDSPGYSCLLSLYDHELKKQSYLSCISKDFFLNFIDNSDDVYKANIEKHLLEILIDECKKFGAPAPVAISESDISFNLIPFCLKWDSLIISKDNNYFTIKFADPESLQVYDLKLSENGNGLRLSSNKSICQGKGMEYYYHPFLVLTGLAGDKSVEGTAWIDHQWGDFEWIFHDEKQRMVLGWDWMGINMNDGSSLIIIIRRDVRTGKILSRSVDLSDGKSQKLHADQVELIPLRYWTSPSTMIRYPVEFRIVIPEIKSEFQFHPFSNLQEIPFFGPMRAIWQGAGEVEGVLNDKRIKGNARVELNGYGYIFDFKQYMESLAPRIDMIIEKFLPKNITENDIRSFVGPPEWKYDTEAYSHVLSRPVWDMMSRNGKRWRPVFGRLLLSALGTDPEPYEELLYCLTELEHTGSLIIDDIQDNSLIRRGEECIHIRYGNDLAINAANTLYFLPNLLLFEHPDLSPEQKLEINELINRGFVQGHLGQGLDLYWTKNMSPEQLNRWMNDSMDKKILQMYALKTAAGIKGLAETAAVIARKDRLLRKVCSDFATALGVAFQIVDDIHNFSDSHKWKKVTGEDIAEGKITFVIYHALVNSGPEERKKLSAVLSDPCLRKNPDYLKEGIEIVRKSGALDDCRNLAIDMVKPRWEDLSPSLRMSDHKILLRCLSSWLLEMKYE